MTSHPTVQVHATRRGGTLVITAREADAPTGLVRLLHVEQHPAMCDHDRCQRLLMHWRRAGLVRVVNEFVSTAHDAEP